MTTLINLKMWTGQKTLQLAFGVENGWNIIFPGATVMTLIIIPGKMDL
jgi:hypothetical protein